MKITITKRICLLVFVCILSITTLARADSTIDILPASIPSLELEELSNDFFTVSLPKGWVMETMGAYIRFGFRAYDPANPARQIFYYGKMEPFIKSYAAREIYEDMDAMGSMNPGFFSEAPVLEPSTIDELFRKFGTITPCQWR